MNVEEYVLQSSVPRHAVELFHSPNTTSSTSSTPRKEAPPTSDDSQSDVEEYVLQSSVPRHAVELFHSPNTTASTSSTPRKEAPPTSDDSQSGSSLIEAQLMSLAVTTAGRGHSSTPRKEAPPTSDDSQSGSSLIEAQLMSLAVSPECSSNETLRHKLSMVQLRLDEATKTLQAEREEKQALHRTIEKLENELTELKSKCEELKTCRQEAARELLTLQDLHEDTVASITADLMDEASTREDMDRRLTELRAQLERLQAENASEWGKRERLETEKL
ncbi:coiled-coil domain-containing protein 102A [Diaphorina citri]|uniref:Coiled-coil domain-containing protein 102A n=1 Tax=Diaphorina citri TaxID=121845 RepID=A0A3Q0J2C7_DIACI|nr:coiled-coil domain-containing protein 102A [Diaphorina citri]